jgi:preprotein translocase subunit SecD
MLEFPRWKHALILLVLLLSTFYALPNIYPQDPAVQVAAKRGDVDAALVDTVRGQLDAAKIPYKSVAIENKRLIVRLPDTAWQTKANDLLRPQEQLQDYTVALNRASTVPAWYGKLGAKPMTLGLDLQGGVHFLMEIDQVAARDKREGALVDEIQGVLRDADIGYSIVTRDAKGIRVSLVKATDADKARNQLAASVQGVDFTTQPDGTVAGQLKPEFVNAIAANAIEQNIGTLRNRVASLAEPVIQRQGTSRIIVQLPGIEDTTDAKEKIGGTATLEWRAVVEGDPYVARDTGVVPPSAAIYYRRERGPDGKPVPILLSKRIIVSGDQLVDAIPGMDPQSGTPDVSVKLNSAGGKRMFKHTLENVGKLMAIVYIERTPETHIDPATGKEVRSSREVREVINSATISEPFGANFHTTGLESEEAKNLSTQIKAGSLAAPMDFVEERVVGPSLGAENVRAGIQAVLYSFVFVMVFFAVYYKMFGIITNLALLMNLLMVVALMSVFGATLTLPGFAGIALTVGMSVDANVLINERIREELRLGLSPLASIAAGYDRASGTIWDANVTAMLGGMAMAAFGSGPIRGFGITLIIGILTSMFTAVTVSRGIATLIYGRRRKLTALSI